MQQYRSCFYLRCCKSLLISVVAGSNSQLEIITSQLSILLYLPRTVVIFDKGAEMARKYIHVLWTLAFQRRRMCVTSICKTGIIDEFPEQGPSYQQGFYQAFELYRKSVKNIFQPVIVTVFELNCRCSISLKPYFLLRDRVVH